VTTALTERGFMLMAAAPVEGCMLEFGVYKGDGLIALARLARQYLPEMPPAYGFDSFEGMPPTSAPLEDGCAQDWAKGSFSDTSLETTQQRLQRHGVNAKLVKGLFGDLSPLAEYGIGKVRFAHIDADIYEGYRDALQLLTPHVQVGTVMLFDEIVPPTDYRYQSIRNHGRRAVQEWERATGFNLHLIRFEWTMALCVIVDRDYLKRYGRVITQIRRDIVQESTMNIALKRLLALAKPILASSRGKAASAKS